MFLESTRIIKIVQDKIENLSSFEANFIVPSRYIIPTICHKVIFIISILVRYFYSLNKLANNWSKFQFHLTTERSRSQATFARVHSTSARKLCICPLETRVRESRARAFGLICAHLGEQRERAHDRCSAITKPICAPACRPFEAPLCPRYQSHGVSRVTESREERN